MNKFLNTFLNYTLVLFALSLTISVYGQNEGGPPSVRKEAHDGGQGGNNCLDNNGAVDHIAYEITMGSIAELNGCDLMISINIDGTESTIILTEQDFQENESLGFFYYDFFVSFTAQQSAAMCLDQSVHFTIDLYYIGCSDGFNGDGGGDGTSFIEPGPNQESIYPECCEFEDTEFTTVRQGLNDGNFISNSSADIFNLDNKKDQDLEIDISSWKSTQIDYSIFDIHGNQVHTLKGINNKDNIQDFITRSSIKTGIYFVRFLDGNKMKTIKIFKL